MNNQAVLRLVAVVSMLFSLSMGFLSAHAQDDTFCSVDSEDEATIVLVNDTDEEVYLFWVNYDCEEEDYGSLASGEETEMTGMDGNAWIIRNADGEELARGVASAEKVVELMASGFQAGNFELKNFDGQAVEVISELEDLDLVPSGGRQLFQEDHAFFTGIGRWFMPMASQAKDQNIVMGSRMTFTSNADEYEDCALLARINDDGAGGMTKGVAVAFTNESLVWAWDLSLQEGMSSGVLDLDYDDPHYLLIVAIDDKLTVFVDGISVIENMTVDEVSGYYGIGLTGNAAGSECSGRDIWVYTFN